MTKNNEKLSINSLREGANVSLRALLDGKYTDIPISIAQVEDEERLELNKKINCPYVALDVIVQEWQKKFMVVSFQQKEAQIALVAVHEKGIFKWDNVKVDMFVLESGKRVHVVRVMSEYGERFNRRRGVRIDFGKNMDVRQGGKTHRLLVKDISYCGVGFVEYGESQLSADEPFVLFLSDEEDGKDVLVGKFTGKMVRQDVLENGVTISGCIFASDHYPFLQKYLAVKQMQQINSKFKYKSVTKYDEGKDWKTNTVKQLEK